MRPNIVLIMTDQFRGDAMGCAGNKFVETPNLDSLAAQGTLFNAAYSPSPSCVPARACLMTGMTPWNCGVLGMSYEMGAGCGCIGVGFEHTLPGELAKAGYQTIGIGKMHFTPQRALMGFHQTVLDESSRVEDINFKSDYVRWFEKNRPADFHFAGHGMDWNAWPARPYHAPEYLHPTYWTVERSLEFLENRDISAPFFLKMSFARPHAPYDPPQYYFDMYMNKDMPDVPVGDWVDEESLIGKTVAPDAITGILPDGDLKCTRAGYYGNITFIDHQIGRLIFYLKNNEIFDNTIFVFSADHGDMQGDHHMFRKGVAYEGSAHIPLIVTLPTNTDNSKNIKKINKPAVIQDIMPTILEAARVTIPDDVDGISLIPQIKGEASPREFIHGENCSEVNPPRDIQYIVDEKFKYIWFMRIDTEQLFDLESDPQELHNLINDPKYSDTLDKMRKHLVSVLEPRNSGYTKDGKLVSQAGRPAVDPPSYRKRYERSEYKWRNGYNGGIPQHFKEIYDLDK